MSAMRKKKQESAPVAVEVAGRRLTKGQLMNVLMAPHVSEKSARVAEQGNQFVFRVRTDATRAHVRQAVELMFGVKVAGVQVLNQPGKKRRFGRIEGFRSGFKKAYVRLAPGQAIDFASGVKP
jgi:large subunit ribosomal protein L23